MKSIIPTYSDDEFLYNALKTARLEVEQAIDIFNQLTDDVAIDYASYNLLAARTKYSYLLQQAKEKQISL